MIDAYYGYHAIIRSGSVIYCRVTNYPKFSILKQQTFNISHSFFESGIQEQLSSVVLAQGLSWGYSRDVS